MKKFIASTNADKLFTYIVLLGIFLFSIFLAYVNGVNKGILVGMQEAQPYYIEVGKQRGFQQCTEPSYQLPIQDDVEEIL